MKNAVAVLDVDVFDVEGSGLLVEVDPLSAGGNQQTTGGREAPVAGQCFKTITLEEGNSAFFFFPL